MVICTGGGENACGVGVVFDNATRSLLADWACPVKQVAKSSGSRLARDLELSAARAWRVFTSYSSTTAVTMRSWCCRRPPAQCGNSAVAMRLSSVHASSHVCRVSILRRCGAQTTKVPSSSNRKRLPAGSSPVGCLCGSKEGKSMNSTLRIFPASSAEM